MCPDDEPGTRTRLPDPSRVRTFSVAEKSPALPAMENEPPFNDAEPHQQHPPFDDAARAAAKKIAAGAGKPRTQEAGLLAIHAALHRKRFQRDEEAYTFFGAKKQRFYEWKPVVEKNDGSQLSVEQARKQQQRTSDA